MYLTLYMRPNYASTLPNHEKALNLRITILKSNLLQAIKKLSESERGKSYLTIHDFFSNLSIQFVFFLHLQFY